MSARKRIPYGSHVAERGTPTFREMRIAGTRMLVIGVAAGFLRLNRMMKRRDQVDNQNAVVKLI